MHNVKEFQYSIKHTGTPEVPGCDEEATLPYEKLLLWGMNHECPPK